MILGKLRKLLTRNPKDKPSGKVPPPFPYYICLETTNACNLRCIHCLYRGGTTKHYRGEVGYMDVQLAKHILDQLAAHKGGVMLNGDGETLLHKHFHEIARYAVDLDLPNIYFNTNGTLLKPAFTDEFVRYFRGSVLISLDGFKESHERIRVGSSYDVVVSNLEYLLEQIGKTHAPIQVSVSFCNYDQPVGERMAFVRYWTDRVDEVSVGEVYDRDYRIISKRINHSSQMQRVQCGIPWETCVVRWNGIVVPCSNCFAIGMDGEHVLGDARRQTLTEIWNGPALRRLRRRTEHWDIAGTICEKCERWNMYVTFGEAEENGLWVRRTGVFNLYRKMNKSSLTGSPR